MNKLQDLKAHTARVLGLCASPDRTIIASIAADETLMLWNCFEQSTAIKKGKDKDSTTQATRSSISMFSKSLRWDLTRMECSGLVWEFLKVLLIVIMIYVHVYSIFVKRWVQHEPPDVFYFIYGTPIKCSFIGVSRIGIA